MAQLDLRGELVSECTFCKIIKGEIGAHVVFEDESSFGFLDNKPLFQGHCLLVPKKHHQTLKDVPPELMAPLFSNAQLLTRAVERAMNAEGSFVAINNVVSQSVPHLHIHVVPRRTGDGLRGFLWPRQRYPDDRAALETQEKIRAAVEEIRRGTA